jgi:hypothetical protein
MSDRAVLEFTRVVEIIHSSAFIDHLRGHTLPTTIANAITVVAILTATIVRHRDS